MYSQPDFDAMTDLQVLVNVSGVPDPKHALAECSRLTESCTDRQLEVCLAFHDVNAVLCSQTTAESLLAESLCAGIFVVALLDEELGAIFRVGFMFAEGFNT